MQVEQIYDILNTANTEVLGTANVLEEDLSNLVDIGAAVFNNNSFDKYSHALIDKVGKMVFVNRPYAGSAPYILMDGTTWGSVIQKVASELPAASVNESWDLQNGASYDPNQFYAPAVYEKFFAKYVTFEVDRSITQKQLKSAFNGVTQMDAFLSMIFNEIEKAFTVALDELIMRTINSAIADTVYADYGANSQSASSGVKAINLLYLYNNGPKPAAAQPLTAANALYSPEFIRFAAYMIGVTSDRMTHMSTLFNIAGKERFTPKDEQHIVMLSEFRRAADVYLQSGTYHDEFTRLPGSDVVPFWQGSGTGYTLSNTSKIDVITGGAHNITVNGVLGVIFDRYAVGVHNVDRWVNTNFNGKADFTNYFYKYTAGYFNAQDEQMVVFFIA